MQPADHPRLASLIVKALGNQIVWNGRFADDPGTTDLSQELTTFKKTLNDPKSDESVVFRRLSTSPEKFLVVRIGDGGVSHGHDGVFLVQPDAEVQVFIYDFLGSKQLSIWYELFAMMSAMFRDWQAGLLPNVPATMAELPSFGDISLTDIASGLLSSYREAGTKSEAASNLPGAEPVTYSLRDVGATLSYGVPAASGQQTAYAQNVTAMHVATRDGVLKLRAQFAGPEFVLVGDARQQFLTALQSRIQGMDSACNNVLNADPSYAADYCNALRDSSRQKTMLLFLSYTGEPPQPQFLVIWTGVIAGGDPEEERDFAFTCGTGSNGLTKFQIGLRLEDPVAGSITGRQNGFAEAVLNRC